MPAFRHWLSLRCSTPLMFCRFAAGAAFSRRLLSCDCHYAFSILLISRHFRHFVDAEFRPPLRRHAILSPSFLFAISMSFPFFSMIFF